MFELGILVDVDHASARTVNDVLTLAERRGVPVLASHVGATMGGRSLGDPEARRILANDGLIGVGLYHHGLLAPVPAREQIASHVADTCDDAIAHWLHYAALGEPSRVMLGSDFSSLAARPPPGGSCPRGMGHAGDLPALFSGLASSGVPEAALHGSADRVLAVWERAERRASSTLRLAAQRRAVLLEARADPWPSP